MSTAAMTGVPAILAALETYERTHDPEVMFYHPEHIWRDVIYQLPGLDRERTDRLADPGRFALVDGTVISYEDGGLPLWQVEEEKR